MKILAWVLGLLALCSTIAVSANWFHDYRQAKIAAVDQQKFADLASSWEFTSNLEHMNVEGAVEVDEKQIENDRLEVEIAVESGRSSAKPRFQLSIDNAKLMGDKLMLDLDRTRQQMGPDLRVENAQERRDAAMASLNVYAAGVRRDVNLAYAIGVVWLAFGFAVALAGKK